MTCGLFNVTDKKNADICIVGYYSYKIEGGL